MCEQPTAVTEKEKGFPIWTVFTYLIVGHLGVWYLSQGYLEAYDLP